MKTYYHATDYNNLISILSNGIKANQYDGLVYLCEKPEDAAKFLVVRGIKHIAVFKVKVYKYDEDKVIETFDHNPMFFKCRAFGYQGDISSDLIKPVMEYDLRNKT